MPSSFDYMIISLDHMIIFIDYMFVFSNLVDLLSPWEPVGRSLGSLGGPPGGPGRPKLLGPLLAVAPWVASKFHVDFNVLF